MGKQLTLNLTGYKVKGESYLILWGGDDASIEMDEYKVSSIETDEEIIDGINDGGFGVESITGARCDIYENYEGTLVYLESREYQLVEGEMKMVASW